MKQIHLYTGQGAYQARDIENFLNVFDFDYVRICEHGLAQLSDSGIFIVPGGAINQYLPAWGETGAQHIRDVVSHGGIYIGICAGSYVAGKTFKGQNGLSFFETELTYTTHQERIDVQDAQKQQLSLLAENGPDLSSVNGTVLLKEPEGQPQLVQLPYKKGSVYLFASHPEGSVYYREYPQEFSGAKWFSNFLSQL